MATEYASDRRVAAVFDLDHTITQGDTYIAFLLGFLIRNPLRVLRSALLPLAVGTYYCNLRDNTWLKRKFLSAILGGVSRKRLASWTDLFVSRLLKNGIRPGAIEVIRQHAAAGHHLIMITASFDFYAEKLAHALGFNAVICTRSEWDLEDKIQGGVDCDNCYGTAKVERLQLYFGQNRKNWFAIVYSDHHSDLPLLEWADCAVVINPKPKFSQVATRRCYRIENWDAASAQWSIVDHMNR